MNVRQRGLPLLLLILALGLALQATLAPSRAAASPRICVYVAGPWPNFSPPAGRSITGHTFVQLLPDTGPQAGSKKLVYGFSTKDSAVWRALGGSGEVQDDSAHPWTWRMCTAVHPGQYDRVQAKIKRDMANPPNYHLFEFNCTDWVLGLVREGNYAFPPVPRSSNRIRDLLKATLGETLGDIAATVTFRGAIFSDPFTVELQFIQVGDGRAYAGTGFVDKVKNNSLPTQIVRGPGDEAASDVDSPARIGQMMLRDPARFGREFGIDPVIREGDERRVGANDLLELGFDGITDGSSLVIVDWGDGPAEFDDPLAEHRYRDPGRYRLSAAVLSGATVMNVEFDVVVRRGEDRREVDIDVPRVEPPNGEPEGDEPVVPQPLE